MLVVRGILHFVLLQLCLALNRLAPDELDDVMQVQLLSQGIFGRRINRRMHNDVLETAESATPPEIFQVVAGIPAQTAVVNPAGVEILKNYGKTSKKKSSVYRKPLTKKVNYFKPELLECDDDQASESSKVVPLHVVPTETIPMEQNIKKKRSSEVNKFNERRANIIRSMKARSKMNPAEVKEPVTTLKPRVELTTRVDVPKLDEGSSFTKREGLDVDRHDEPEDEEYRPRSASFEPAAIIKTVHIQRSVISHSVFPED